MVSFITTYLQCKSAKNSHLGVFILLYCICFAHFPCSLAETALKCKHCKYSGVVVQNGNLNGPAGSLAVEGALDILPKVKVS
jgi:hypothetical protein